MTDQQRCLINEVTESLRRLLKGKIPEIIEQKTITDEKELGLVETVNLLIEFLAEIHQFISPLAQGKLQDIRIQPKNFLGSPFKEFHSRLLHLTWQAEQVAKGDYGQRVDFMGDFSNAFNAMVVALDTKEKMLRQNITELEDALGRIKHLEGILPICANCKKIRLEGTVATDQKNWVPVEKYIKDRSDAQFTHSLCPACAKILYPEIDLDD